MPSTRPTRSLTHTSQGAGDRHAEAKKTHPTAMARHTSTPRTRQVPQGAVRRQREAEGSQDPGTGKRPAVFCPSRPLLGSLQWACSGQWASPHATQASLSGTSGPSPT